MSLPSDNSSALALLSLATSALTLTHSRAPSSSLPEPAATLLSTGLIYAYFTVGSALLRRIEPLRLARWRASGFEPAPHSFGFLPWRAAPPPAQVDSKADTDASPSSPPGELPRPNDLLEATFVFLGLTYLDIAGLHAWALLVYARTPECYVMDHGVRTGESCEAYYARVGKENLIRAN